MSPILRAKTCNQHGLLLLVKLKNLLANLHQWTGISSTFIQVWHQGMKPVLSEIPRVTVHRKKPNQTPAMTT
jgi:hypothetical protein